MHCGDRCKALCGHRARLREHLFSLLQLAGIQQLLRQRLVKVDAQAHGDLHGAPPLAPGTARTLLTAARAEDAAPSQTRGALPEDPIAAKEPGAAHGTGGRRWKPDPIADPDAAHALHRQAARLRSAAGASAAGPRRPAPMQGLREARVPSGAGRGPRTDSSSPGPSSEPGAHSR